MAQDSARGWPAVTTTMPALCYRGSRHVASRQPHQGRTISGRRVSSALGRERMRSPSQRDLGVAKQSKGAQPELQGAPPRAYAQHARDHQLFRLAPLRTHRFALLHFPYRCIAMEWAGMVGSKWMVGARERQKRRPQQRP